MPSHRAGATVGIDLGTTNSVVASLDGYGRPVVLANRDGRPITPSVIYFGSDPPAVGDEAKEWARLGNDEIASFFKPHMGSASYRLHFGERDYDATELSSLVLKRLKEDAETALGRPVDRAVITVPAYFADPQRKATIEAGRRAGLDVLRIINEPTAAALAYGMTRTGLSVSTAPATSADESVLIYDLGGGTFDVTVAKISPSGVDVLATSGDHDLGGKNWDDRIATFLAEKFHAATGVDPLDDPVLLNEVLTLAEQAKWSLSERTSTRVALQLGRNRQSFELTRAEFEGMTAPLMDRTRRLTEEALGASGLTWAKLAGVLLVGGSTRMPMVRSFVRDLAGREPRSGVNVDEVVALGAALSAAVETDALPTSPGQPRYTLSGPLRINDVMAHSLGVVAVSPDGSRYLNDIILPRNQPIPTSQSKPYVHATMGGRNDALEVYLTQGESDRPLDCSVLGKYVFSGIRNTDAEVMVDVALAYDRDGVVQVQATQRDTRHRLSQRVEPVPDDLSWLGRPPEATRPAAPLDPIRLFLLIDVSASMAGEPLLEAQSAALEFLDKCDFTRTEVGLISFSDEVVLQTEATDNARKVRAAIGRLQADGTTDLASALELARHRLNRLDRLRYLVILTDGYPDAPEAAVLEAVNARNEGVEIVAIGTGDADLGYLQRLASTEAGSIFAKEGELVGAFGHIARMIAQGGRALRKLE